MQMRLCTASASRAVADSELYVSDGTKAERVREEAAEGEAAKAELAEGEGKPRAIARPLRKTREAWHILRGSEVGYVVFKAVLLFAVCWMVGAARYVPPFAEVFGFNPLMLLVG